MNTTQAVSMGSRRLRQQAGLYLIEFSMVALFFFAMVFTVIEVGRALFLWNTLQEVTRRAARAASVTDFSDTTAMAAIAASAIFTKSGGNLTLGAPITDQYVRIDYLAMQTDPSGKITLVPIPSGSMPGCPARNRVVCTKNSGDPGCVRLVRARICKPGAGACDAIPYETLLPLVNLATSYPVATSIVRAESLGYTPGKPMCN